MGISVNECLTGPFQIIKKVDRSFSFCCHTHTGTGVHLTSYPKCTSGSFPGNKLSGVGNKPLTLISQKGQNCVEFNSNCYGGQA